MKQLSKLAAILAALVLACAFVGCSNGSDGSDGSDDSTASFAGTYECSFSPVEGKITTMTLVTKDDGTFTMTQVTTRESALPPSTGTYKVSGTTATIYEDGGSTMTATTSDNWKTIFVKRGIESYTFTKK